MKQLLLIALLTITFSGSPYAESLTNAEIKKQLIQESLANYPGNCPCPYNSDRAGRSCGRRSAYNRAGGYTPLCYERDVTQEMIDGYRQSHSE